MKRLKTLGGFLISFETKSCTSGWNFLNFGKLVNEI